MACLNKRRCFILSEALLLVLCAVGIGVGCALQLQWLIIASVLGLALVVIIGVIMCDCVRQEISPVARANPLTAVVVS